MKIIKIIDKRKTCTSKRTGKEYHPSYYVLSMDKMNDGIDYSCLINLVDNGDRKVIDVIADIRVKEAKNDND